MQYNGRGRGVGRETRQHCHHRGHDLVLVIAEFGRCRCSRMFPRSLGRLHANAVWRRKAGRGEPDAEYLGLRPALREFLVGGGAVRRVQGM